MTLTTLINTAIDEAGPMQGTPKQIAWADSLADTRQEEIYQYIHNLQKQQLSGIPEACQRARLILRHNQATWWIDHRDQPTAYLLSDAPMRDVR